MMFFTLKENAWFKNKINLYLIFIFLWVFLNQFLVPLVYDDLQRSMISALYQHNIIHHLINDYQHWTGRMSAQWLVYIFFNRPYEVFLLPVAYGLIGVSVAYIFYAFFKLVTPSAYRNDKVLLFLSCFILILSCFNGFLRTIFFKTTGLQYVLGMAGLLWFVQKEYFRTTASKNYFFISGILGFLLGFYNEIYFAVIFISYCFLFAYYFWIDRSKTEIVSKDSLIFFSMNLLSGIFAVLAPGNQVRRMVDFPHTIGISFKETLMLWWEDIFFGGTAVHIALISMMLGIICFFCQKKMNTKKDYLAAFLFVSYNFALFLMFVPISGTGFGGRKLILHFFIFLFFIFHFSPFIFAKISSFRKWQILLMQFLCSVIFAIYTVGIYDFHRYYLYLMEQVRLQKDKEIVLVKDHKLLLYHLLHNYEFTENINHGTNKDFAKYYQIRAIKIQK